MQEGLAMTCRNDSQRGFGPVQLSQELHSYHPFGKSPEGHTIQFRVQGNITCWRLVTQSTITLERLALGLCVPFMSLMVASL